MKKVNINLIIIWIGAGVCLLFAALWFCSRLIPGPGSDEETAAGAGANSSENIALEKLGGVLLGRYLAEHYPGQTIGVVTPPDGVGLKNPNTVEQEMLTGLMQAVGSACELRISPLAPLPGDEPPLWYPAALFDQAFGRCMDCAVIVTLAGMPENFSDLRFWWREQPPPLIIANSPVTRLKKLIETGKIRGALVRRPWLPGEPEKRGDREWLLITTDNLAESTGKYSSLFAKD